MAAAAENKVTPPPENISTPTQKVEDEPSPAVDKVRTWSNNTTFGRPSIANYFLLVDSQVGLVCWSCNNYRRHHPLSPLCGPLPFQQVVLCDCLFGHHYVLRRDCLQSLWCKYANRAIPITALRDLKFFLAVASQGASAISVSAPHR
jgi:hypothetical protein